MAVTVHIRQNVLCILVSALSYSSTLLCAGHAVLGTAGLRYAVGLCWWPSKPAAAVQCSKLASPSPSVQRVCLLIIHQRTLLWTKPTNVIVRFYIMHFKLTSLARLPYSTECATKCCTSTEASCCSIIEDTLFVLIVLGVLLRPMCWACCVLPIIFDLLWVSVAIYARADVLYCTLRQLKNMPTHHRLHAQPKSQVIVLSNSAPIFQYFY